jgi:NADPH-dependent 2,4-dienoyl-CoA reductase/sulfur reductase-like enzyme/rhodanese-related sulfurtransferase
MTTHAVSRTVVIVGGVAAGMSAAARLRRLDERARIIVFERDDYVSFANCGLPYHISGVIADRDSLFLVSPADLRDRLNLDVYTGHEVTAIDRAAKVVTVVNRHTDHAFIQEYDQLVLACGAAPIRPPMPGVEHPRIFTLRSVADMDAIKGEVDGGATSAVVIGGGYIGVELAEALHQRGLAVTLVEKEREILPPLDPEMDRALVEHMEAQGVVMWLGAGVTAFADRGGRVVVALDDGRQLEADLVVLAIGVRPATWLAQAAGLALGVRGSLAVDAHLRTSDPDIYAAGDGIEVTDLVLGQPCVMPLAGPANRQGRIVADNLCGRPSVYRASQGTSVVKVFDMTGGGTGATEAGLRRAGVPYRKVYLHPHGHASYYPGTRRLHLKLLFAPDDGRLLGAQAVGFDGVDKRLDVLATALRAGMTVFDLEELELAYAPPYGSAKDPVNLAGFIAGNVLRGDLAQWYAEDYPAGVADGLLLDVREPDEFAAWHLPDAVNIPVGELRGRLAELAHGDPQRPLYVYCLSGFRSYLATRLLMQSGCRRVANLAGGLTTFRLVHPSLVTARPAPAAAGGAPALVGSGRR